LGRSAYCRINRWLFIKALAIMNVICAQTVAYLSGRHIEHMSLAKIKDFVWPVIGFLAVIFSGWLLYREFSGLSAGAVLDSLRAIPAHRWALAVFSTLIAYGALAWYDRIALMHLGHKLGWGFISAVSFSTYALSHNIGASVFSGAVVRLFYQRSDSGRGRRVGGVMLIYFHAGLGFVGGHCFGFRTGIGAQLV
jgi:glycosyltransferase 2 family protein